MAEVTPTTFTAVTGDTLRFFAEARNENGAPVAATFSWGASAGTISNTGILTAGAPGEGQVWATSGQLADTSTGTIFSRPTAFVDTVFFEGFEANDFSVWDDRGLEANQAIVTTQAHSGLRALRFTFPLDGEGGWLTKFFMPGYDSLYVSLWVKLQAGWVGDTKLVSFTGSRTDNQWSAIGTAGACPTGTDFFVSAVTRFGDLSRFYSYYPGMPREGDGVTCYGDGLSTGGGASFIEPTTIGADEWHRVELWVKLNVPSQANSIQRFWIDGVLRGTWTDISLRSSPILRLNGATITASRGGGPAQAMYVDDLLVARSRPEGTDRE